MALSLALRCYHYACPECGMTDAELGELATDDEIHCYVCLVDDQRHVVLRRWATEARPGDLPLHPSKEKSLEPPPRR